MEIAFEMFVSFAVQLFIIVDPIAAVPVFLTITPQNTRQERKTMALRACLVAFLVVVFFILAGPFLLGYFSIQNSAVRICGGILMFVIAIEMLYGRRTGTGISYREERLGEAKEDISITPLAIPLLAGPGAITTSLIFSEKAHALLSYFALLLSSVLVFSLTYLFLRWADELVKWIGILGTTVLTRIMGLILAFIAVQYVVDGIRITFGL
jgi:multiple antibiotic resistance protein